MKLRYVLILLAIVATVSYNVGYRFSSLDTIAQIDQILAARHFRTQSL
jgi:hypothetical protein